MISHEALQRELINPIGTMNTAMWRVLRMLPVMNMMALLQSQEAEWLSATLHAIEDGTTSLPNAVKEGIDQEVGIDEGNA